MDGTAKIPFHASVPLNELISPAVAYPCNSKLREMYTDKKENKIFPQIQGNSEWSSCKVILGSPSSYMTLQLLHSEFPYI